MEFNKIARRIAGLANAALGEPVILLIGLSEEKGVIGITTKKDLAEWWPQVRAEFDGEHPSLQDMNLEASGQTIVALCFETDRAPYVVKNAAYGTSPTSVSCEVPWREGTSIRSARRADLLRILTPKIKMPIVEIVSARMNETIATYVGRGTVDKDNLRIGYDINFSVYLTPVDQMPISFPFHSIETYLEFESGKTTPLVIRNLNVDADESDVQKTSSGITFKGPGAISIFVYGRPSADEAFISENVSLSFKMISPALPLPLVITRNFRSKLTLEMLTEKIAERQKIKKED